MRRRLVPCEVVFSPCTQHACTVQGLMVSPHKPSKCCSSSGHCGGATFVLAIAIFLIVHGREGDACEAVFCWPL